MELCDLAVDRRRAVVEDPDKIFTQRFCPESFTHERFLIICHLVHRAEAVGSEFAAGLPTSGNGKVVTDVTLSRSCGEVRPVIKGREKRDRDVTRWGAIVLPSPIVIVWDLIS